MILFVSVVARYPPSRHITFNDRGTGIGQLQKLFQQSTIANLA